MKRFINWIRYHPLELISIIAFILLMNYFKTWALIVPGIWIVFYVLTTVVFKKGSSSLLSSFKYYSCILFGYRRKGKGVSLQHYFIKRYKKYYDKLTNKLIKQWLNLDISLNDIEIALQHYWFYNPTYLSNVDYGYGCRLIDIVDFELINEHTGKSVTYHEFINGMPIKCNKLEFAEGLQMFIDEAHLLMPNTEFKELDKKYPWLGVFVSVVGHLYSMELTFVTQEFDRAWVKIRNQQDRYVNALKVFPKSKSMFDRIRKYFPIIRNGIISKFRVYEKSQSAEQGLLPFDALGLVNEVSKPLYLTSGQATKETYQAQNGEIIEGWIFTRFKDMQYDTRMYHQIIFNEKAPK